MYTVYRIHHIFARYLNSFDTSCGVNMGRQNALWMVWGLKRFGSFWFQSCLVIAFNQPWVSALTATAHRATHLESACRASFLDFRNENAAEIGYRKAKKHPTQG